MNWRIESSTVVGKPASVITCAMTRFEMGSESTRTPSLSKITRSMERASICI
jgi:hypothetical protein